MARSGAARSLGASILAAVLCTTLLLGDASGQGIHRAADADPTFPLSLDPTGEHLVDADGDAFLIHGDAAWSLIVQLDPDQTTHYLTTRREQGFNTLVVNLIEHHFSDDPPRDEAGREPFLTPGDFSTPNDDYFDAARAQIRQAEDQGFMVLLAPAYLGFDGGEEGWYADMQAAGPEVLRAYGRYVGQRFADADNVIWLHAGDYTPPPEGRPLVEAIHAGLLDAGATQLRTAHGSPADSSTDLGLDIPLDIDATYDYGLTYVASREDHTDGVDIPHFLFETSYENDGRDRSLPQQRAQAYGALLSGAIGQVYGHGAIWPFVSGWETELDAPGAQTQVHVGTLFDRLPWTRLEPDIDGSLVVEGTGTFGEEDFTVAVATGDRGTAVAYVPAVRPVTLDLQRDPAGAVVEWFDPSDGTTNAAEQVELGDTTVRATPPGPNAAGDPDWVLVVELPAPSDDPLQRVRGPDRFATAVAVSRRVLDNADAVVLASGEDFPDALVSGPLAIAEGAALLLTGATAVPEVTLEEIDRLGASRIVLLGGRAAISDAVADALVQRGLDVERVSGADRIATALAAADRIDPDPGLVVLVSGVAFPDALSGAGLAAALGVPLLLTGPDRLSPGVADAIGAADVLVVGGRAAIGEGVMDDLRDRGATPTRLAGDDRYGTSAAVVAESVRRVGAPRTAWVATGRDFPDGLVAAAAAARDGGVVLLTEGRDTSVPQATADAITSLEFCRDQLRLVGGRAALSGAQESALGAVPRC